MKTMGRSSWSRGIGNMTSFIGNSMEERAALAASDSYRYIEKRKPIPDPQDNGLIYGNKKKTDSKTEE
ncbi:hypothetical protein V6N12_033285 [Hibiscus sabdariffa]|uniref:Uncharacterized protein n=1 Tax=Hibiscus sabdariffa TaxID=183260 RepID=A0ABR2BVF7_9ROSI